MRSRVGLTTLPVASLTPITFLQSWKMRVSVSTGMSTTLWGGMLWWLEWAEHGTLKVMYKCWLSKGDRRAAIAWVFLAFAAAPHISMANELPQDDTITMAPFGTLPSGAAVTLYTLRNRHGMEVRIITYGGIVTSLTAPDRNGRYADVVLGYDSLEGYLKASPYFGALIGRYGNRIAKGRFALDGHVFMLAINNPPNSLHGGTVGFDKVIWTVASAWVTPRGPKLALHYLSRDGEEGYPGNLSVTAVYTLTDDDSLRLDYTATTDKDTVVNLTQHSYFNLRADKSNILGHVVQIDADRFTPVDDTLIPTGELRPVAGTPFDFRTPTVIGARIEAQDEELTFGHGYDHNWVLNKERGVMSLGATVYEPDSGRVLEVLSTEPGLQFYSGNFLDGTITGKGGRVYERRAGFCMEPQHFPDSPNDKNFPSTVLKPRQTYKNTIVYRFTSR
jgi:aldose 1-epimerase